MLRDTLTHRTTCTDEEVVAKLAELDIVVMDLERANARVIEAQSKNVGGSTYQVVGLATIVKVNRFTGDTKSGNIDAKEQS